MGDEVSVDAAGAVTVNYPTTAYCADITEAKQKYSRLTGTTTYGAKSFSLSQQTSFLDFVITFADGTLTNTTLSTVVSNSGSAICTGNVTSMTESTKVVAKFVLPLASGTTLSSAKLQMDAKEPIAIADGTLTGNVMNVNGTQLAVTNLSATATANTYMVTAAGTYKFKATVKGNGGIDPLTGVTATPITGIASVKVLWELSSQGKAIKHDGTKYDISYVDGYVYFSTPETFAEGSAYVAVCDNSDNILWSWLIWATNEPSVIDYSGLHIMDRNLGAIGAGSGEYRGFAYEWGRKDPFPEAHNGTYTPVSFVPERMTAFSIVDHDASGMTVAYTIAHPTEYPKGWLKAYWQTSDEFSLNMWWSDAKTIYDPCPPGWKVPSKAEMEVVVASSASMPGVGFIGNVSTDFDYGNPGSCYYWTSTGVDRNHAWGWYGSGFSTDHVDNATRSGYTIRPIKETESITLATLKSMINSGTDCSAYIGYQVNSAGKIAPVAISGTLIGYIGYISTTDVDNDVSGSRILVIASSDDASSEWGCEGTSRGLTTDGLTGYSYTNTLQGYGSAAHPAAYNAWNHSATIPTGGATPAHWFLPTKNQLENIISALGGFSQLATKIGWNNNHHWSSTESDANGAKRIENNGTWGGHYKNTSNCVRACFAY